MTRAGRVARSLGGSGLVLALAACAAPRGPIARPLAAGDTRPAALVGRLAADGASRHALRGVARLALDGPSGAARAKQILLVERPARLRAEILGLLDQTVALLVTDGVSYRLVRSDDPPSVERGPVDEALLAEIAGIAFSPQLAVRVLLAAPAESGERVVGGAALSDGGVRAIVTSGAGPWRESFDFDGEARLARWARLGADGEPLLEARWDDWRPVGASLFPHALELTDHATGAHARLAWSRLELDPPLAPALFDVGPATP